MIDMEGIARSLGNHRKRPDSCELTPVPAWEMEPRKCRVTKEISAALHCATLRYSGARLRRLLTAEHGHIFSEAPVEAASTSRRFPPSHIPFEPKTPYIDEE